METSISLEFGDLDVSSCLGQKKCMYKLNINSAIISISILKKEIAIKIVSISATTDLEIFCRQQGWSKPQR